MEERREKNASPSPEGRREVFVHPKRHGRAWVRRAISTSAEHEPKLRAPRAEEEGGISLRATCAKGGGGGRKKEGGKTILFASPREKEQTTRAWAKGKRRGGHLNRRGESLGNHTIGVATVAPHEQAAEEGHVMFGPFQGGRRGEKKDFLESKRRRSRHLGPPERRVEKDVFNRKGGRQPYTSGERSCIGTVHPIGRGKKRRAARTRGEEKGVLGILDRQNKPTGFRYHHLALAGQRRSASSLTGGAFLSANRIGEEGKGGREFSARFRTSDGDDARNRSSKKNRVILLLGGKKKGKRRGYPLNEKN